MQKSESITMLLKTITNEYEKQFNQLFSAQGLTSSQCAVLQYLFETEKEYINQIDIEQHLRLKNPTVTGLLKRLDEKGYVLIVPSNQDKRKKNVYLTEQAYRMQKKIQQNCKSVDKQLFKGMKKTEIVTLQRHLNKILQNIEE